MAGHSKWANIKHKKSINDAKRAKLYTKLIKEIKVAVKEGGNDPLSNSRLKLAIQNAKGSNVPKNTIDKAISKSDTDNIIYTTTTYEGNGPNGIAILIECITDNLNRTISFVRSIFSKYGGSLGKKNSIAYLFDKYGHFIIKKADIKNEDDFILKIIDFGILDIQSDEDYYYLYSGVNDFGTINKELEKLNIEPILSELTYVPNSYIDLTETNAQKGCKLLENLDENDDIHKVYHNLRVSHL